MIPTSVQLRSLRSVLYPVSGAGRSVLGIDVGEVHVGLAVSDPGNCRVSPLMSLQRRSGKLGRDREPAFMQGMGDNILKVLDRISTLIETHDVACVVVGFPYLLDGSIGSQCRRTVKFSNCLVMHHRSRTGSTYKLPCILWDERFTTARARENLKLQRKSDETVRKQIDALAAANILKSFLYSVEHTVPMKKRTAEEALFLSKLVSDLEE